MRKKLVALAAMTLSGATLAQSSVTLYGIVDVSYARITNGAGSISGLESSDYNSSRLGFRGVEDLGGGLTAKFTLEGTVKPENGSGGSLSTNNQSSNISSGGFTFNRRSVISLAGAFGEIALGRDFTPSYNNYWTFDPFGNNGVGTSVTAFTGVSSTFVRASNSIDYILPAGLGGFYGQAMYAFGNRASTEVATVPAAYGGGSASTSSNGRYTGLRLGYGGWGAPFDTAISYGRTTYAPGTVTASLLGLAGVPYGDFTDMSWGAAYQFGSVRAMALVDRHKFSDAGALGNEATARAWNIGAVWDVGAGSAIISYGRVSLSSGLSAARPAANKWSVGYVHNLSKRMSLYAAYTRLTNSGGAAQTAGYYTNLFGVSGPANVNQPSTGINLGVKHSF